MVNLKNERNCSLFGGFRKDKSKKEQGEKQM